jgi:hypothetical protein
MLPYQRSSHGPGDQGLKALKEVPCACTRTCGRRKRWLKAGSSREGDVYRPLAEDGVVRMLISAAGAAPSIHNTQPWRFRVTGDLVEVHGDPGRMLWVADPQGRALHLSCGAALYNLRLAIRMLAAKPLVWPLPDPQHEPTLLAAVQLEPARPATSAERELFEVIGQRHSSRAPFSSSPIPDAVQIELEQQAGSEFALLRTLNQRDAALVLDLAAAADQALERDFEHRVELSRWVGTEGDDIRFGYGPPGTGTPRRSVEDILGA